MFNLIWPVGLVVLANVVYNITQKTTPSDINAFFALTVTYVVAAAICFAVFLITGHEKLSTEIHKLNWASFALGISIVALEVGYIYIYRNGWKMNTGSLVANIALAIALIAVGFILYKERLSVHQIIGIFVCIGGLVLVTV